MRELALVIVPQCPHFARSVAILMLSLSIVLPQFGQINSFVMFVYFFAFYGHQIITDNGLGIAEGGSFITFAQ